MVRSEVPEPAGDGQSLGDLVALAAKDVSQLIRYEIDLAKTELKDDVQRVGLAAALGGVAAFVACLVLVLLSIALAFGLVALGIWTWAAFLIVAGAYVVFAVLALGIAYLKVRRLSGLKKTRQTVTEGLDGLRERLAEYRDLGARFAKWRGVYSISDTKPSEYCIWTNAHALARYAALCQEAGIVPIVEPEVLQDGTHSIERSEFVTSRVLAAVYTELFDQRVDVAGTLLKPNMVLSGYETTSRADVDEVADQSLHTYYKHVPAAVPGIVFLSGGQSDEDATAHLNAMNARGPHPWQLSFSYGRALQAPSLNAWGGKPENVEAGQRAYYHRAKMNSAARSGLYAPEMEREAVAV